MTKLRSEKGSITVFVIVAFIFWMAVLLAIYWTSSNNQVAVLQSYQRIKEVYGEDVNRIQEIYESIGNSTIVI